MNSPELQIPLYHVDTQERNKKFVYDGAFFPSDEDGLWCGKGMYFWDSPGNARYWQNVVKSHGKKDVTTVIAYLKCPLECILDLTDNDQSIQFLTYAQRIFEDPEIGMDVSLFPIQEAGSVINTVHDYIEELSGVGSAFSVVREDGTYPRLIKKKNGLLGKQKRSYNKSRSLPLPTEGNRRVYAIRDGSLLKVRSEYEEGDNPYEFSI